MKRAIIGDTVVCVRPRWDITLGTKYKVLDIRQGYSGISYYTIIDNTGVLVETLYRSIDFLLLEELQGAVAIK